MVSRLLCPLLVALSVCTIPVASQFVVIKTITAESSQACNQLCIADTDCVSADYGSPSLNSGSEEGKDFVAHDRSCIMYGKQAVEPAVQSAPQPTPAPVVIQPVAVKAAPSPAPVVIQGPGMQYQVYIKAAQCRFVIKGQECEFSTKGSIHLIFHGTTGTSSQDVIWRMNGLRAGMANTVTVNSDDVGIPTYISFFVPGKDTFKPEIIVINKLTDGSSPGSAGVYFTESELLMSESMLEPHELADVGRYYYRYPLYESTCTKSYASLTDWFLKCRPNKAPTPAPQEYCGDIEINALKNYWLIEQKADSNQWRYFEVELGGLAQALAVEVLPEGDATLQVALCPHCPRDGACQGVPYGQYGAYEDRNYMNLTRTSLGQRKMWTAVPPAMAGASYKVGVNDPDLVRMSNRWYVAVRSSGAQYESVYYKIRARFGMDACTKGYGSGALVNGRGQDDYATKRSVAAPGRRRTLDELSFEERMRWGLTLKKLQEHKRRLQKAAAAATPAAATPAPSAAACGTGEAPCGEGLFCDFAQGKAGACVACAGASVSALEGNGAKAFAMKCDDKKQADEQVEHAQPPAEAEHAGGAQCGRGSFAACAEGDFCNFDGGHVGHCVACKAGAAGVGELGEKAFGLRCAPLGGGAKDDDDKAMESDDEKKATCGGHYGACEGDLFCNFANGESGECEACGGGCSHLGALGARACEGKCAAVGAGPKQPCSKSQRCAEDPATPTYCHFTTADGGSCEPCASVPAGQAASLFQLAQLAYKGRCHNAPTETGAALGGGLGSAHSLPPYKANGNMDAVRQCGGAGMLKCGGGEFCTFHSDGGASGVCRLCSTMPDCTKAMGAKGQEACKLRCVGTAYPGASARYGALGGTPPQAEAPAYQAAPTQTQAANAAESYAQAQAQAYDAQQAAEEAAYQQSYTAKQTEYEAVHNEPYACPLYVDYPTLDVNLGSHGQRPAVVDPYIETCPGIDEAWCKQTHYMCDASNYGLAMKPAPLICAAMAEGWDAYGAAFGCATLPYDAQSLLYEVACDLGPGPQLYGLANAESSSPNLVVKSNFGYHYTFPRHTRPPVPCEPVHFACETPECYLSARPLGCMCHEHRVPECQMVDDREWAAFRQMGYVHSHQYHMSYKVNKPVPANTQIRGKSSYATAAASATYSEPTATAKEAGY